MEHEHHLAMYLANMLLPLSQSEYRVQSSDEFVKSVRQLEICADLFLCGITIQYSPMFRWKTR